MAEPRKSSAKAASTFDAERHLDMMTALVDMPVADEHREGVCENLSRIHAMATLVFEADVPENTEPASVHRP